MLLHICLSVPSTLFAHFSLTVLALGPSPIVKVLGQNDTTRLSSGVLRANGFRLPKGSLECSPNCSAHSS